MQFGFNVNFTDLNNLKGLRKIDELFCQFLKDHSENLYSQLISYRNSAPDSKIYSEFIINVSPILDDFLERLFNIEVENSKLKKQYADFDVIYECRRKFVQRYALSKYPKSFLSEIDFKDISLKLQKLIGTITERSIALKVLKWQKSSVEYEQELDIAAKYAAFMVHNNSSLTIFDIPRPITHENLIRERKIKQLQQHTYLGFDYRDKELTLEQSAANAKYCIYCHKQNKDSCSKGMELKSGCPLKQKISEMNLINSKGFNISALAIITIDNPMVAATGHRICNDCMKACIFQKQDPVNIPIVESKILENVLELPYGVEIYLLLTKWNPLNLSCPLPQQLTGRNVLVTGLGPAGFALSHYLLNDGHNVTAIDGLKIKPLAFDPNLPIMHWSDISIPLSEKMPQGFGGVAEYGITNRWNKNNLTLVRLVLERRENFNMYGGVRLGSNITADQAFSIGFDHIALCVGAGAPKFINSTSFFAKGVRSAADFLMTLQQGGAYLPDSLTNLMVRLPAAVIGLGLTAVDSAVEIMHYYPKQVLEFAKKYEKIKTNDNVYFSEEEIEIAEEFISHAALFKQAKNEQEKLEIIKNLGGVTICYRGNIKDSPAYRLNHEEIEHAMALGINFREKVVPLSLVTDNNKYTKAIEFADGSQVEAKTVFIAIGTEQNDFHDIFRKDEKKFSYFGDCNQKYSGNVVKALASAKDGHVAISEQLRNIKGNGESNFKKFTSMLDEILKSTVIEVNILTENIIELIIKSQLAAKNFQPGQFFRLQNFANDPSHSIEPIALTGAEINKDKGTISLIILEMGTSSKLCREFKVGQEIVLMGPAGVPTEIAADKNIALVGGGLGNAALLPIGKALIAAGSKVIYFAGYKKSQDRIYPHKIEESSDIVIWSCEEKMLSSTRYSDLSVRGKVTDGIITARKQGLTKDIDRIICIGSDKMMRAISANKKQLFGKDLPMICSINSPMQCMMKGICGQCIQKTSVDRGYIFSCACQDQFDQNVDFKVLSDRLNQNSLFEKV